MTDHNPYHILGVPETASQEDIKRAFRKKALGCHPDMNDGSGTSVVRFREIADAYSILRCTDSRRAYDRANGVCGKVESPAPDHDTTGPPHKPVRSAAKAGPTSAEPAGVSGAAAWRSLDDFLNEFASPAGKASRSSGPASGRGPQRGGDLRHNLELDFKQAYHGVEVQITLLHRRMTVRVPGGVDNDAVIRVPGGGAPGLRGGAPGDLYLLVTVARHPHFRRCVRDIYLDVAVTPDEAATGITLDIPGPKGPLRLRIPPGIASGTFLRFRGLGFPSLKDERRGDFFVKTFVVSRDRLYSFVSDAVGDFGRSGPTGGP